MPTSLRSLLCAAGVAALCAAGTLALAPASASAEGKNLKILPDTLSKAELKATMKGIAKSLGVQCDHCHDTDDYAKDTEHKEIARTMMRMTAEINQKHFKGEQKVGCITCHNGQKEPKGPPKQS